MSNSSARTRYYLYNVYKCGEIYELRNKSVSESSRVNFFSQAVVNCYVLTNAKFDESNGMFCLYYGTRLRDMVVGQCYTYYGYDLKTCGFRMLDRVAVII